MSDPDRHRRSGLLLGLGAYLLWGFLPIYFKALAAVLPSAIVAHRILWSLAFLGLLILVWRRWSAVGRALRSWRVMLALAATAVLIGGNWLVYIWAVLNGHVLEGSLGYYLNPLVNVVLGVMLLKERLRRVQIVAVAIAAAGVAVLAVGAGEGLWISLTLALSFALYGFIRKVTPVDAVEGLTIETVMLAPFALLWLAWLSRSGDVGFADPATNILIVLSGAATAIPLLLFTAAAKRLPYSTLGFLQYIAPSLQFLSAVLLFGERLTTAHIICFAMIWSALAIFAGDGWRVGRAAARARAAAM